MSDAVRLEGRSPTRVIADLRIALAAEEWDAVRSCYAEDAYLIRDDGVDVGRDAIVAAHRRFAAEFGGPAQVVLDEVAYGHAVRVLYTLDLGFATIPDGVDTYVVREGRITLQTSHGRVVPVGVLADNPLPPVAPPDLALTEEPAGSR